MENKLDTDCLTFSCINNILQGDEIKAGEFLFQIAWEKEELDKDIASLEFQLEALKSRANSIKKGALNVLKHIERESPLIVQREGSVVVVTDVSISIEKNVI